MSNNFHVLGYSDIFISKKAGRIKSWKKELIMWSLRWQLILFLRRIESAAILLDLSRKNFTNLGISLLSPSWWLLTVWISEYYNISKNYPFEVGLGAKSTAVTESAAWNVARFLTKSLATSADLSSVIDHVLINLSREAVQKYLEQWLHPHDHMMRLWPLAFPLPEA